MSALPKALTRLDGPVSLDPNVTLIPTGDRPSNVQRADKIIPAMNHVYPGDSVEAHSGSAAGPTGGSQTAGPVVPTGITVGPTPVAGGSTVIGFSGQAGQTVTVINSLGQVLGSGTVPATGPAVVFVTVPLTPGEALQLVVNGVAGPGLPLVGPAGPPPVVLQGAVLVEGSTLTGTGVPGATVQVVDAQGRVLGSTVVDAFGNFSVPVSGAVAGVPVKLVMNGVAVNLNQPALALKDERVFLNSNIFRPEQGSKLDIGFKANADERVTVRIFNLAGEGVQRVAEMEVKSGILYALKWDGRNDEGQWVAAGVYIVSVYGPNTRILKKVVVLK
jgi:hypothetical protein